MCYGSAAKAGVALLCTSHRYSLYTPNVLRPGTDLATISQNQLKPNLALNPQAQGRFPTCPTSQPQLQHLAAGLSPTQMAQDALAEVLNPGGLYSRAA